jgi:gluconolactonase
VDPHDLASLVSPGAQLRRLWTGAQWTEGPVYLAGEDAVLFSDIPGDRVIRWSARDGGSVFLEPAGYHNGHALDLDGSVIACSHGDRRIERLHLDGTREPLVDRYRGMRLNSPNDVVVKRDGTIWFTDPPYGILSDYEGHKADPEIGACLVFRFDPRTGALDAVTDAMVHPNGLAFSLDESLLYVSDTEGWGNPGGPHHILAFDVVDGRRLEAPRTFYDCPAGVPDGFRLDEHGNVFTSSLEGIHVVAPDGSLIGRIPVPERTSNCVFGGPDGRTLFITAGSSLYAIDTLVRGAVRSAG